MRDDILAKRMFLAGCFGLPWLWAVHSLYWYRKQQPNHAHDDDHQDALLATPSSSDTDGSPDDNIPDNMSPEEVKREALKWVRRCTIGSIVSFCLWASWIVLFCVFQDSFPASWFIRSQDQADLTGW